MKGIPQLVEIVLEEFIDKNWEFASAAMIAEVHPDKWVTETYVRVRMRPLHSKVRKARPKLSTHLVTDYYVETVPDVRRFFNCQVPPVTERDKLAFDIARLCLAIGNKGCGIRFVPNKLDYFCRANEFFWLTPACGLMKSRVRSVTQAVENKQISQKQAMPQLVKAALMFPEGIKGTLPPPVKEIKKAATNAIQSFWEANFNKKPKGTWGRWGEPL